MKQINILFKAIMILFIITSLNINSYAQFGNELDFDGVDDYVNTTLPSLFTDLENNNLTVEALVSISETSFSRVLFAQLDDNNLVSLASIDNQLIFYVEVNATTYSKKAEQILTPGQKYHYAASYDATTNEIIVYIDGEIQTTVGIGTTTATIDNVMSIGGNSAGSQCLDGTIDELRIWSDIRTETEISDNKDNELTLPQNDLVAYYKFNQGIANGNNTTITTLFDELNNFDGTLNNFALTGTTSNFVSTSTSPIITTQPTNQSNICVTDNVSFTVVADDTDTYQWQVDEGSGFENIENGSVYTNVTTSTLDISGVTLDMNNYQYRCYLTNAIGNTTSDAAVLTLDSENPVITCIENQTIQLEDGETIYTVSGTEFDPTQSSDNCDFTTSNDFNNEATLDGAELPIGTTTVEWTITDNANNSATCSFDIQVDAAVNGIEALLQNGISIYPNPTNGKLNFEFTKDIFQKISLFDITGKTIIEKTEVSQNTSIDLSGFETGIYIIKLQTDNKILTTKIMKE